MGKSLKYAVVHNATNQGGAAKPIRSKDSFEAVAKRLECDPDLKKFDAKLKKIAKAKPPKGN
jgi:hypothetical protein